MALYDDAIVDAKKLREVAENAAKQQILETITPKIRALVNAKILKEQEGDLTDLEDEDDEEGTDDVDAFGDEGEDAGDDLGSSDDGFDSDDLGGMPSQSQNISLPPAPAPATSGKKSAPIVINNTGDINIGSPEGDATEDEFGDDSLMLSDTMAENLAHTIQSGKKRVALQLKVDKLHEKVMHFKAALKMLKENTRKGGNKRKFQHTYRMLVREAVALRREVIQNGGGSQRLERKLVETLKEMRTMSAKTKRNIFDFLFEGEDQDKKANAKDKKDDKDLKEAELTLNLDDEEKEKLTGKESADDVDAGLKDLLSSITFDLGDDVDDEEGAGEEDVEDFGGDEPDGDEGDVGGDDFDVGDLGGDEPDGDEEAPVEEGDVVYEIDEGALRRELSKMKTLRESRNRRIRRLREETDPKAGQFGGGEVVGDVFYDVDESTLINVLEDELGSVTTKPRPPGKTGVAEAAVRRARKEAAQYKVAAQNLQSQLVEMNLFNAKLLYANKLMQNKSLSLKQQKAIVEALDNAKTLQEAKLLYKTLSESLARKSSGSNLSENVTRTSGSSSRSTRSAQSTNNGVEVDRWATLAGLPEGAK